MVIFPCTLLSHCSVWQSNPRVGITQYSSPCPCRCSWKRTLCHALYQAAAVSFTPCLVLKIRNCEVSPFSQHMWQFSYCFGHQGAGLWAGTTLVFDGGRLYLSAFSCLFPILQLHTAFPSHGCHWELQCEMGCEFHSQIYILREVKKCSV